MHRWTCGLATAVCVILSQPAVQVADGGCFDWMFGREPERPAVAYYAPATTCSPCCPPTVAYSVPTTTSAAPMTCGSAPMVYSAPQTVAPARINPIPQTYYRTTYKQIPVTVYRPIAGTDVVTGYPVTINRACTTNEWQVQRVPTGVFGMGRLPGKHAAVPMAGPNCSCNAATTMPAAPYYTPPAGGMAIPPTTPMTPGMNLPPTMSPASPPTMSPASPPTMTPGTGGEPAEQRPSLSSNTGTFNGAAQWHRPTRKCRDTGVVSTGNSGSHGPHSSAGQQPAIAPSSGSRRTSASPHHRRRGPAVAESA